jgi:hypothetical protein
MTHLSLHRPLALPVLANQRGLVLGQRFLQQGLALVVVVVVRVVIFPVMPFPGQARVFVVGTVAAVGVFRAPRISRGSCDSDSGSSSGSSSSRIHGGWFFFPERIC